MTALPALQTREALLKAAHELLSERGGGAVSVSDIAGRAGVNVAMVKYCFGSKDGLLDALLERVLTGLAGEIWAAPHRAALLLFGATRPGNLKPRLPSAG